ncbi:MAG: VCBS repeat-containing protein [Spirochaetales bacterium]|nr:VCBS repeat-containing protein [Spirochaetales bacterium]
MSNVKIVCIVCTAAIIFLSCSDMLGRYTGSPALRVYGFDITLEWHWNSSDVNPNSIQVMCAPVVADLNHDGIPDIIFHSYEDNYQIGGILRAISGDGSGELFSVTAYSVRPGINPAVGDIDNDGRPEIITVSDSDRILAFEHDGSFKWQSEVIVNSISNGSITLADIDEDGSPEVILGSYVLNSDGTTKWIGANPAVKYNSYVINLDCVGHPELITCNTVYHSDGSVYWEKDLSYRGYSAAADLDDDSFPELVYVYNGGVYIWEHDGTVKYDFILIDQGGGPPTIVDVDNDGDLEICISFATKFVVLEADGTIKWSQTIDDTSSRILSSSAFDFDNDGIVEVLHADQAYFRIFNGQDGSILYERPVGSGTLEEFPLVVDVDNDNSAEIIVVSNDLVESWVGIEAEEGILVFGDANNSSVNTRKIWNQHYYFITNVRDNCSIPQFIQNNWNSYNNFRQNPPR